MCMILGMGVNSKYGNPSVILVFNIGDLTGKFAYNYLPITSDNIIYVYGISRTIILATLYGLAIWFENDPILRSTWFSVGLLACLSVTGGHLTVCLYNMAPGRVEDSLKKYTRMICVMGLLFGLLYGSIVSLVSLN